MNEQQITQWIMGEMQKGGQPMAIASQLAGWGVPQEMIMRLMAPMMQAPPQQQQAAPPWGGGAPAGGSFGGPPQQQQQQWGGPPQQQGFGGGGFGVGATGGATALPPGALDKLAQRLGGAKDGNVDGRKLPEGVHLIRTTGMKFVPTFYAPQGKFFHEFIVLESSNTETEIGGSYSEGMDPNDQYGYGLNDIRGLLNQAVEHKLNQNARVAWDPRFIQWALSEQQPCTGILWRCETHERAAKKSNNPPKMIHDYTVQPDGTTTLGLTARAPSPQMTMPAAPTNGAPPWGAAPQQQQQQPPWGAAPAPQIQQAPATGAPPWGGTPMQGGGAVPPHIAAMFGKG